MDLTEQNELKHTWVIDESSGDLIVTIGYDEIDPGPPVVVTRVVIDTIRIEPNRMRAFSQMLFEISKQFFPEVNIADYSKHRTVFDKQSGAGSTRFFD